MAQRPIVLIVDDDPMMRSLLCDVFSIHGGFRIGGVAADGMEGAFLAADLHPDVVILDFFMPRWDGSKAAEFIREHCPEAKIIAFSAVLTEAPDWGDTFLLKTHINELTDLAEEMAA
jgi:chemotaxis response regulator CheB